jgi:hypothetical protein
MCKQTISHFEQDHKKAAASSFNVFLWLGGSQAKAWNEESLIRLYSICSW